MTTGGAVAKRITRLLHEQKITQYRLEQSSGLTHGAVDGILSGHSKTVTLATLYKLARGFHMTIFEFLDDDIFRSEDLEVD